MPAATTPPSQRSRSAPDGRPEAWESGSLESARARGQLHKHNPRGERPPHLADAVEGRHSTVAPRWCLADPGSFPKARIGGARDSGNVVRNHGWEWERAWLSVRRVVDRGDPSVPPKSVTSSQRREWRKRHAVAKPTRPSPPPYGGRSTLEAKGEAPL